MFKKHLFTVLGACLFAAASVPFVSCSDDDDESPQTGELISVSYHSYGDTLALTFQTTAKSFFGRKVRTMGCTFGTLGNPNTCTDENFHMECTDHFVEDNAHLYTTDTAYHHNCEADLVYGISIDTVPDVRPDSALIMLSTNELYSDKTRLWLLKGATENGKTYYARPFVREGGPAIIEQKVILLGRYAYGQTVTFTTN